MGGRLYDVIFALAYFYVSHLFHASCVWHNISDELLLRVETCVRKREKGEKCGLDIEFQ